MRSCTKTQNKFYFCMSNIHQDPNHRIIIDRMENSIKGSRIGYNLLQRGGCARAVCTGPPPPPLTPILHRFAAKLSFCNFVKFSRISNFVFREIFLEFCKNSKLFRKTRNFDKIIFHFAKLEENFAKHEIKNFAATLLLHNLPSATYPPLLSARRFFNAARQCYFEMKNRNFSFCHL